MDGRVPTFLLNVDGVPAEAAAARARRPRASASGTPTTGTASPSPTACPSSRSASGLIHYNTADEVDRLLAELGDLAAGA